MTFDVHAYLTTLRCVPRSILPSSVATVVSTTSPSCRYLAFLACAEKNIFHLTCSGSRPTIFCTGFGGADSAVPTGRAGHHEVTRSQLLEPGERGERLGGPIDHVAVDRGVLAQFAVHAQLQAQLAEAIELVGIQQYQRRPDGRERRIRL